MSDKLQCDMCGSRVIRNERKWISTGDRMPPDGKLVLIHPGYGPMMVSFVKRNNKGRPFFYAYSGRKVTHWMELPDSPGNGVPSLSLPPNHQSSAGGEAAPLHVVDGQTSEDL